MQLSGVLSGYGPKSSQLVHVTGSTNKHLVVIGGLTDGLKADGFAQPFLKVLEPLGWSVALGQLQTCFEVRMSCSCRHLLNAPSLPMCTHAVLRFVLEHPMLQGCTVLGTCLLFVGSHAQNTDLKNQCLFW